MKHGRRFNISDSTCHGGHSEFPLPLIESHVPARFPGLHIIGSELSGYCASIHIGINFDMHVETIAQCDGT